MKLNVSWTNNSPEHDQRVYLMDPTTWQKKRIADAVAGATSALVDLDTLPNGPFTWPAIVAVLAVSGDAETPPASFHYLFNKPAGSVADFAGAIMMMEAMRPQALPLPVLKSTTTADVKFNAEYPHFVADGGIFQCMAGASERFDTKTLATIPVTPAFSATPGGLNVFPVWGPEGQLYFFGDGADSEKVWRWEHPSMTLQAVGNDRTAMTFRYTFNGADGRTYRIGGADTVVDNKLVYTVFDPVGLTFETVRDDTVAYQGNGGNLIGGMSSTGTIVLVDTSNNRLITLNTVDGTLKTVDYPNAALFTNASKRAVVGFKNEVFFATSSKTIQRVNLDIGTGEYLNTDEAVAWTTEAGLATSAALAITGEVVFGTADGKLLFVLGNNVRIVDVPNGQMVTSIIRSGRGLTVVTTADTYFFDFEGYQYHFDAGYDQSHVASTCHFRNA